MMDENGQGANQFTSE